VRDAGCLMHPQPCAQKRAARPRTSLHSGGTGKPGNPARNGVTAYTALSSGRCSFAPVVPRMKVLSAPGWADEPPQDLTPASGVGPHGFAVRFDIVRPAQSFVSSRAQLNGRPPCQLDHARYRRVHRISSRVRDDRDTPLVWDETKRVIACFEQKGNRNIFDSGAGQPETPELAGCLLVCRRTGWQGPVVASSASRRSHPASVRRQAGLLRPKRARHDDRGGFAHQSARKRIRILPDDRKNHVHDRGSPARSRVLIPPKM